MFDVFQASLSQLASPNRDAMTQPPPPKQRKCNDNVQPTTSTPSKSKVESGTKHQASEMEISTDSSSEEDERNGYDPNDSFIKYVDRDKALDTEYEESLLSKNGSFM